MLQFWFPKEEFHTHLQPMVGYSEFCRNAILKEIEVVNSDQYLNNEIQKHKTIIQELQNRKKEVKKAKTEISPQAQEIIDHFGFNVYKDRIFAGAIPSMIKDALKVKVIPRLKKVGCRAYDENSLYDYYKDKRVEF